MYVRKKSIYKNKDCFFYWLKLKSKVWTSNKLQNTVTDSLK